MGLPRLLGTIVTALCMALSFQSATANAAIDDQNVPAPPGPAPEPPPAPVLTRAPELQHFVGATYPTDLLYRGVGGEATLLIDIDPEGMVARVEVAHVTHPAFAGPAMDAASQFRFTPAEVDHIPAAIRIEYKYVFTPTMPKPDAIAGLPTQRLEHAAAVNFKGQVLEAGIRNPLRGAVIRIAGRAVAESDAKGNFEIRGVRPGEFAVHVSGPHHDSYEVKESIEAGEALEVRYYLVRTSNNPFETVVRTREQRREVAKIQLDRKELEKVPGTFGDAVRVIENLPGMARTPGGLGGALLVRGANPTDTGVYFDGVEIPLIYHFGGLTSVVASGFLERIDFFPGGFGAKYGGAIAGVVNVISRDLDCEQPRGYAQADFIDAEAYTCAPVGDWHVAVAARRSYFDAVLPVVLRNALPEDQGAITAAPVYWDYQAKGQTQSGGHRFDVFAFGSDDKFKLVQSGSAEDINFNFGLHLAFHRLMLRHRYTDGKGLHITSMVAPGYQSNGFKQSAEEIGLDSSFSVDVQMITWREEISLEVAPGLTLSGGLDIDTGRADLFIEAPIPTEVSNPYPSPVFDFTDAQRFQRDLAAYNHGYWMQAVYDGPGGIQLVPGLRIDRMDFHHTQEISVQPRMSARWQFMEGMTAKAAWGIYETLPEPNFLVEAPIGNPRLEPLSATHWVAGYEHEFTDIINVDLQVFYNQRRNLVSTSTDFTIADGEVIPEVWNSEGGGRTYGLELLLRHLATNDGWFYGWVAYTLSRSVLWDRNADTTQAIQQNEDFNSLAQEDREAVEYISPFDQTHILTLVGQFMLPWGIDAGLRYRLVTGNPVTPLEQGQTFYDADADRYQLDISEVKRNSGRLPVFHQLDVRIDKTWTFDLWKLTFFVEVFNAYNHKNVEQYTYDYRTEEKVPLTLLPIVPNIGFKGEF